MDLGEAAGLHRSTPFRFGKALIAGGAGFVGSHLAERLLADGVEVTILDNLTSGFESNVPKGAVFHAGDVRDKGALEKAAKGSEVIFHLAEYIPNYPGHVIRFSSSNPREDLDVCVGGTINALEEARKNGAAFVLASTAAVYGSKSRPVDEESPMEPISPYGASKLCAEAYVNLYRRSYGLPVTIFRFFNIYGPRQRKYLMYDCLLKMKLDPKRVELLGTGKEVRDYIYVDDAIDQILALMAHSEDEPSPVFNIGSGVGRTSLEVAGSLARLRGIDPEFIILGSQWTGNSNSLVADVSRSRRHYKSQLTDFEKSLGLLASWFDSAPPQTQENPGR